MEKRYQIFVSSTFVDMPDERQAVIQAILRMYCFPAGMELFPASDDDSWKLIERVIDDSDYYIVVVRGRYGSIHPKDGLSYTEKEYRYARSKGIPVLPFLYRNPGSLRVDESEPNEDSKRKLDEFRKLLRDEHHYREWSTKEELQLEVYAGLSELKQTHSRGGWIQGKYAMTVETMKEIEELRAIAIESKAISGTELLAQGNDSIIIKYTTKDSDTSQEVSRSISMTWDQLFELVGTAIYLGNNDLSITINGAARAVEDLIRIAGETYHSIFVDNEDILKCMIHLQALRLIEVSIRSAVVRFIGRGAIPGSERMVRCWSLTEHGMDRFVSLRAIRKPAAESGT